jgi:hypothetical protein
MVENSINLQAVNHKSKYLHHKHHSHANFHKYPAVCSHGMDKAHISAEMQPQRAPEWRD